MGMYVKARRVSWHASCRARELHRIVQLSSYPITREMTPHKQQVARAATCALVSHNVDPRHPMPARWQDPPIRTKTPVAR